MRDRQACPGDFLIFTHSAAARGSAVLAGSDLCDGQSFSSLRGLKVRLDYRAYGTKTWQMSGPLASLIAQVGQRRNDDGQRRHAA